MSDTMDATRRGVSQGGGKLILFGEHAVVYGHPAIVAGLGRGATASTRPSKRMRLRLVDGETGAERGNVEPDQDEPLARAFRAILDAFDVPGPVEVTVTVGLPLAAGLGSSAAIATAVAHAIATFFGQEDPARIVAAVEASETVFHLTPSGIDQAAAHRTGLFEYRRTQDGPLVRPVETGPLNLLVCHAGRGASTADMVARVRALHTRQPQACFAIDEAIGALSRTAIDALGRKDLQSVGELMDINHGLLVSLGVSTNDLDHACHVAREAGALGAKLTGSGGGGCVVAIAPDAESDVLDHWQQHGWRTYAFEI